jgi:hypothetical protein
MPRLVIPHLLELRAGALNAAVAAGRIDATMRIAVEHMSEDMVRSLLNGVDVPVSLRWANTPALGFPRRPWRLYRRPRRRELGPAPVSLHRGFRRVDGSVLMVWGGREMFEVRGQVRPDAGQELVIDAVDSRRSAIRGQRIVMRHSGPFGFRHPGIAALEVRGKGEIGELTGIDQLEMARSPDWELLETVGLPLAEGEVAGPAWEGGLQGWEAAEQDPVAAALVRLRVANALQLPLPATEHPTIPTPDWPALVPEGWLDVLRLGGDAPLARIRRFLEGAELPSRYIETAAVEGIGHADPDMPSLDGDPRVVSVDIPVVPMTMVAVTVDSFSATALGYGTTDLPPNRSGDADLAGEIASLGERPPEAVDLPYDYMVVGDFLFFGIELELAALAHAIPPPTRPPASFQAEEQHHNRAPRRDARTTAAVRLRWEPSDPPLGYVILRKDPDSAVQILNARRSPLEAYEPLAPPGLPDEPDDTLEAEASTYVDPLVPIPLDIPQQVDYGAMGLDSFGRWSAWGWTSWEAAPPPPAKPTIIDLAFELDGGGATGSVVPGTLVIDFAWNWSDRSARLIEFTGTFVPWPALPEGLPDVPEVYDRGFVFATTGDPEPAIAVRFPDRRDGPEERPTPDPDDPRVSEPHSVEVLPDMPPEDELPEHPDPDTLNRRYRLRVGGMKLDFSSDFSHDSRLLYAVYARATEAVRTAPGEFTRPRLATAIDPRPPDRPSLTPRLIWTALPDARGMARGLLEWPPAERAHGYVVWEAVEPALRSALEPPVPDPGPGIKIPSRALELQEALNRPGADEQSRSVFARVNTQLISSHHFEVELPGYFEALKAYRVSALGQNNEESGLSEAVFFAVPQLQVPGTPRIVLRTIRGIDEAGAWTFGSPPLATVPMEDLGIVVLVLPSEERLPPAGFRLHRAENDGMGEDVGAMGPPIADANDPRWILLEAVPEDPRLAHLTRFLGTLTDYERRHGRLFLDQVPSVRVRWQPWYYRVIAVGPENRAAGRLAGSSRPSQVASALLVPPDRPQLNLAVTPVPGSRLVDVRIQTDLPDRLSPLGPAFFEAYRMELDISDARPVMRRRPLLGTRAIQTHDIPRDLTGLERPALVRLPRSGRLTTYLLRLSEELERGFIVVRDPLGRTAEEDFEGSAA